jgi:hypothetical protein
MLGLSLLMAALLAGTGSAAVSGQTPVVALAYVHQNAVTLADSVGNQVAQPGPNFEYGQGARLLWTPDGDTLYIARSDGLFATGADGAPAVRVPGAYGRTLTFSQDAATIYYLETGSPQPRENTDFIAFPLREVVLELADPGMGRLTGYYGNFQPDAGQAMVTFAAALYARDGGLLGAGRPEIWPTYGANIFGTCCFPYAGLGSYNVGTGSFEIWDDEFVPGAAALNLTRTHLAGPTILPDTIRIYDLITGGWRDYAIQIAGGLGIIERVAWSPDDTYLYFVSRYPASNPLTLDQQPGTYEVDPRSADIVVYRLNLVTGVIRELARRQDVYGVSSLAAAEDFVFAVVVDPNTRLVADLNARQVRPGSSPTDPEMLATYLPATHLWRIEASGSSAGDLLDDVWGVSARPIR